MNNKNHAAEEVASLLRQLERDLDQAFASAGRLAAALPVAQSEARLSAVVGQQAFEHFGNAVVAIGTARGHTVAGHRILEAVAKRLGYQTAYGDVQPKFAVSGEEGGRLRVAA